MIVFVLKDISGTGRKGKDNQLTFCWWFDFFEEEHRAKRQWEHLKELQKHQMTPPKRNLAVFGEDDSLER